MTQLTRVSRILEIRRQTCRQSGFFVLGRSADSLAWQSVDQIVLQR